MDSTLDAYAVAPDEYVIDPAGPHGWGHSTRVLALANAIAAELRRTGERVDIDVVRWAAACHDVKRHNDGVDPEHGARAADWIRYEFTGGLGSLSDQQREAVAYCCEWHVAADRKAPSMTAELCCLKDADSLDRVRFAMLDLSYLRTAAARTLVPLARELFASSRLGDGAAVREVVRQAAAARGVWQARPELPRIGDGRARRCTAC